MADQITRNNHYVPQWYQRRFLEPGQSKLHYLDMSPKQKHLQNGCVISMNSLRTQGPKSCFMEQDLYSTFFGSLVNDEVEKFLFGSIDDRGAKAIRAFSSGNVSAMHRHFQDFFEYLDSQKLRTPKGLAWIKSRYASLDQTQLMVEMQGLRFIHCTMWTEGVREIVSASESDVKFIISDHPVTVYNAATPPESAGCAYPSDPSAEWIGTITVFPLDADSCLILSHLEYAKNPGTSNLTTPRTNARFRGESLVRTDAFIRTRKLSRQDVIAINQLIKSRAGRYVAAANKEWLFPEKSYAGAWADIASVLLPKDELWRFGGEIYVGHDDGSTRYQDAFGRSSGSHRYLRRKRPVTKPGPNEACGCGSGRKYKICCRNLPVTDRPTWEVYGLRERNLMLCRAAQEVLGLTAGKTWDDVRREISDEHVVEIHRLLASLWPVDTDLSELLPRPDESRFRALYLGPSDPRNVEMSVLALLPYFDEVVVCHPFVNPVSIKPEFSPTSSPSQHKLQMLKNVRFLLSLAPFIDAGRVHMVPNPGDFNPQFGMSLLRMAEERTVGWEPSRKGAGWLELLAKDDERRLMRLLPEDYWREQIRQQFPELDDAEVEAVIEHGRSEVAADPYALLQPIGVGEAGAQLLCMKGFNLESSMYLASLTGSFIYTDVEAHWQQLHSHALQGEKAANDAWASVVRSIGRVDFPVELSPRVLLDVLETGRFGTMRSALRRFNAAVRQESESGQAQSISEQVDATSSRLESEWSKVDGSLRLSAKIELSVPRAGFERHEVRRLLLTFGRGRSDLAVPFAMFVQLSAAAMKETRVDRTTNAAQGRAPARDS